MKSRQRTSFQRLRPAVRKRSYGGLIAAVVALLVIAGGGYGIWLNKDAFATMFGLGGTKTATIEPLVKAGRRPSRQPMPPQPATTAGAPAAATDTRPQGRNSPSA